MVLAEASSRVGLEVRTGQGDGRVGELARKALAEALEDKALEEEERNDDDKIEKSPGARCAGSRNARDRRGEGK